MPNSNRYSGIYSSDSEDDPVLKEMISNDKTANSINTYSVVPLNTILSSTSTKVLNKKFKTRVRTQLVTIKREKSDTTASSRFLSNALHSVSQAITHSHTDKIALYNNIDTA